VPWDSFVATTRKRFGVDLGKGPVDVAQTRPRQQAGRADVSAVGEIRRALAQLSRCLRTSSATIAPPDLFQGAESYPRENDADEKRPGDGPDPSCEPAACGGCPGGAGSGGQTRCHRRATLWAAQGHAPLATAG
jgi:hypothetical protein